MNLDNLLIISITLVFLTAIIGTVARRRRIDRVLRDLQGFQVTAKRLNKAPIWGKATIYANGIEFGFDQTHTNRRGNQANSCLLYKSEYADVTGLFRFYDVFEADANKRRSQQVDAVVKKRWHLVVGRKMTNFLNTFRDAINESLGLLLKHAGRGSDNQLKQLSSTATGLLSAAFDPILENHIGDSVILEQIVDGQKVEYVGILSEYSDTWISLYECRFKERLSIPLQGQMPTEVQSFLSITDNFKMTDQQKLQLGLSIKNNCDQSIYLQSVEIDRARYPVNTSLMPAQEIEHTIDIPAPEILDQTFIAALPISGREAQTRNIEAPDARLMIELERRADVYLPRLNTTFRNTSAL